MAALVDMAEVLYFLGLEENLAEDFNLLAIRDAVEAWIQNVYCRRTFAVTSYKEKYNGTGSKYLTLNNYPTISLSKLSMGTQDAISVKNTNLGAHAAVSVNPTDIVLVKDNDTVITISLATYDTLAKIVNAINTHSSAGWMAGLLMSTYSLYPSSILLEKYGLQCIASNYVYLPMPDEGEDNFEIDPVTGIIYSPFGFPVGIRNIYVDYSAGLTEIPEDLKLAIKLIIKVIYQRRSEESFGVASFSTGGISVSFEEEIPIQAKQILNSKYRRYLL